MLWLVILSIFSASFAYDEKIRISDLYECEEMFLDSETVQEQDVYEISSLCNNKVSRKEILNTKLIVLGHDMHIKLSNGSDFNRKHYEIYISGNGGNQDQEMSSGIAVTDPNSWNALKVEVTENLTDTFFTLSSFW